MRHVEYIQTQLIGLRQLRHVRVYNNNLLKCNCLIGKITLKEPKK